MLEVPLTTLLEVNNIEVVYNNVILVLKGLSLKVEEGTIVALLGSNGAGKSTTLKAISGFLPLEDGEITDGSIVYQGESLERLAPHQIVRQGIFQVMEGRRVFEDLTVEENLSCGAYIRTDRASVRVDRNRCLEYFPVLKRRIKQTAGYLSGGEQQMLVMSRAFLARPKLMMLDEPSTGTGSLARGGDLWDNPEDQPTRRYYDPVGRAERTNGFGDQFIRLHHGKRPGGTGRHGEPPVRR
jgi:branched-chain amino acid transport system ATP-binding protein